MDSPDWQEVADSGDHGLFALECVMYLRTIIAASVSGIVCLGASVSAASAQQAYSWTGFSVWAGGGGHELDGDVNVRDTTTRSIGIECEETSDSPDGIGFLIPCIELGPFSRSVTNRIASSLNGDPGVFGTVGVGYDFEATPGVVIGAFADIDWSNADASFSGNSTSVLKSIEVHEKEFLALSSTTSVSGSMDYGYSYTIGGRIGVLSLDRSALLYVLAGYTRLEMDGATAQVQNTLDLSLFDGYKTFSSAGNPISVRLPDSFDGYTIGVGGQVKLTQAISIKLEGRYSGFESKSVSYSSSKTKEIDLLVHNVGIGSCKGKLFKFDDNCRSVLKKTTSSSGKIDIDPEIYSLRAALVFSF